MGENLKTILAFRGFFIPGARLKLHKENDHFFLFLYAAMENVDTRGCNDHCLKGWGLQGAIASSLCELKTVEILFWGMYCNEMLPVMTMLPTIHLESLIFYYTTSSILLCISGNVNGTEKPGEALRHRGWFPHPSLLQPCLYSCSWQNRALWWNCWKDVCW